MRYEFNDIAEGFTVDGYDTKLISIPCGEWREELYRHALQAQVTNSVYNNYYDSELIAEWRGLYNPMNSNWDSRDHWNPDVFENPKNINFWLDFIDTGSEMGKYSISEIGRRTKVINSKDLKSVYNSEVPDIIFIEGLDQTLMTEYKHIG
ncbi:MAG: hypothetical protein NC548_25620 [Lachnospiraceae bacterium]|nr:hypothetical protein [Lachnospiraceae bacterium]